MKEQLKALWQTLTLPKITDETPSRRYQVQLLAAMLLAVFVFTILFTLLNFLLQTAIWRQQNLFPLLFALSGNIFAYWLSRGRYFSWAPILFALTFSLGTMGILVQNEQYQLIPIFLIIPTLFLTVFVSIPVNIGIIAFNILVLLGLFSRNNNARTEVLQSESFVLYLVIVSLGLLLTYYRNAIEQSRQAELHASQARLRTFFDTANDWIFALDPTGRILYMNETMCAETGYEAEMVIGRLPSEFLTGESAKVIAEAVNQITQGHGIEVFTAEVNLRNGRHFWVEVRGRGIYDAQGNLAQTIHIARDITSRMAAAAAEKEQRQLVEALSDTAAILNSTLELDEVLDRVLDNVHRVVPFHVADILLEQGEKTVTVRHRGYEKFGAEKTIDQVEFVIEETGTLHRMRDSGEPIIVADTRTFPGWLWIPGLDWVRSMAGTPIIRDGKTLGYLSAASINPHTYTIAHAERLQAFASHVANAIHNARLYAAEQEQRQLAEALQDTVSLLNSTLALDEVLDHVLSNIHRVVPYDVADIMLIANGKTKTVRHRGYEKYNAVEIIEGLEFIVSEVANLRLLAETGQPLAVRDTRSSPDWVWVPGMEWIRSLAGAPIITREAACIGFLHVTSSKPDVYTSTHAASLSVFANHVANAIHNAQLFAAEKERRRLAETLRQTTAVLNSTLALDDVLNRILEQLSNALSFDSASLQKREGDELILRAVRGFDLPEKLINLAIPIGTDSPNAYAISVRRPVTFPDIAVEFPHFHREADRYQSGKIRSWLAVPLMFDEEIIGLVTIDRNEVRPFTPEEIEVASTFAYHAAIALHNADLYDQLARYNETLETAVARRTAELQQSTQQVTTILNNSPDAILLLNHQLHPLLFNPAYKKLFGYESLDSGNSFPNFLVVPADVSRFRRALQFVLREGQPLRMDFTAQRQDGSQFDADIALSPIQQQDDEPILLCSIRDITALKEIERVKDDFVSNVSHELRTPIASLQLYHDLLTLNPAKSQEYTVRLGREISRLNTIVEGLLQLSRLDQERIEWNIDLIDLNRLVEEYATDRHPLAASRSISLDYNLTQYLPLVLGDKNLLGQVLSILLTNALNYTPPGGQIILKTAERNHAGQKQVGFQVTDSGQGIHADEISSVLNRFYRGKAGRESGEPGTGLGLAIADEIVRRHQGHLEVWSAGEHQGATFSVWLPIAESVEEYPYEGKEFVK